MKSMLYICLSLPFCFSLEAKEVQDIKSMKEFKETMCQQKPLIIMFYAPWCAASKEMTEALNQASTLLGSQANIIKIDVEKDTMSEVTDLFCIDAVPTIVVKHTGRVLVEDLVSSVKSLIKKPIAQPKKNEPLKKENVEKKTEPRSSQTQSAHKKPPVQPKKKHQSPSKK